LQRLPRELAKRIDVSIHVGAKLVQRSTSQITENRRLDLSNRKAELLAHVADCIRSRRLLARDLRSIDPTLSPKQVSRLRDEDHTVCSLDRLERIAAALECAA